MKRVLVGFALGACIAACDSRSSFPLGPSTSTPTPAPTSGSPTLLSVTLSVNANAMRSRGDTAQTTATGTFSNGTSQDVIATCSNWQSDHESVLTVNSRGLITAQGSGTSAITTTCQVVPDHAPEVTIPVLARTSVTLTLGPPN